MNGRRMTDIYKEDEISLVDIWQKLVERKKFISLVWISITLIGVAAAVLLPDKYAYTTLVEIGSQVNEEGKVDLVEPADATRIRLLAGIIPIVQRKYVDEGREEYDVEVQIPEKSPSFLLLESRGSAQFAPDYLAFQAAVVEELAQTHQTILNNARRALTGQQEDIKRTIAALQNEGELLAGKLKHLGDKETLLKEKVAISKASVKRGIAELQDSREILAAKLKRLEEEEVFLKEKIETTQKNIASAARFEETAIGQQKDEAAALTHMMVVNQTEQQRGYLATLEKRLLFGLPAERVEITKALADQARALEERRGKLGETQARLEGLHVTKAVLPPTQSNHPVGPKRLLIVALATVAGLMTAIVSVFLREFFLKARREIDMTSAGRQVPPRATVEEPMIQPAVSRHRDLPQHASST